MPADPEAYFAADPGFYAMPIEIVIEEGGRHPTKAHPTDVGWDLYSSETRTIYPHDSESIPTGIRVCVPPGFYYRIVGRSSSWRLRRLLVLEGTIDAGYHGLLFVETYNFDKNMQVVSAGERIAQIVIAPVIPVSWQRVNELSPSERGERGYGSSGL